MTISHIASNRYTMRPFMGIKSEENATGRLGAAPFHTHVISSKRGRISSCETFMLYSQCNANCYLCSTHISPSPAVLRNGKVALFFTTFGLCGTFLPCILECKVAQDSGETCCVAFLPGSSVALRTHIRHKYRIEGSVCNDWCVMACLYQCGLCQMAREQKMRA
ncbi:cornifelin homolog isoform X1 [Corythoichthys intestinalis]|uniref:cornifelin homolog isoform X1 n=1 Tax=Corythoichthys intestinalis TaxID=161448 RepID=UPI0025A5BFC3|nr:cornifelin homolog isoform X1 [Corythoichthys intestinalis]